MFFQIICSFLAGLLVGSSLWKIWQAGLSGLTYVRKLPQVPCVHQRCAYGVRCVYFTGDYRLKCTVNPYMALTEDAIDCRDFEAKVYCQEIPNSVSIQCKKR